MRVFNYWRVAQATVLVGDAEKTISCFGGSNFSEMDALSDGQRRLEAVKRRIAGFEQGKGDDYEADILEEPLKWIGREDVVTRNRYGAEVLNSTSCVFVDIDEPVFRIWQIFRRVRSREQKKRMILEFLGRRFAKADLAGFAIRVYETHSGMRLLLEGRPVEAGSTDAQKLLRSFHADRLYALMCRRQKCYRARLTPKPHRMKIRPIRLRYPYEDGDRKRIEAWIGEYDSKSGGFATCRLVQVIGSAPESPAVRYHDERTKAASTLPLA